MSEYKRLTERVGNEVHELACSGEILYGLAELEDDLESGKLVGLPCRVGDKIYTCYAVSVDEWEVQSIQIFDFDVLFRLGHKGTNDYNSHYLSDFGKTIFFTKAEAEKKLEELSKNR